MPRVRARPPAFATAIAWLGGVLFVASLLFFLVSDGWRFDAEPAPGAHAWVAGAMDVLLFTVFALHHSVFARTGIKAWIARVAPPALERSIYVWISSALFLLTCALWQPVAGDLWRAEGATRLGLWLVQAAAGVFTLASARHLDFLHLAGIRQVIAPAEPSVTAISDRGPYGLVRHPIYLGWFLLVWPAPLMNGTRLLFALTSSAYLIAAVPFEERDLRRSTAGVYDGYARRVRWKILPYLY